MGYVCGWLRLVAVGCGWLRLVAVDRLDKRVAVFILGIKTATRLQ